MKNFFKPSTSFSFSAHPFDLRTFIGLWHSHDDNHFLLKIYGMGKRDFADYYNYHLKYAIENNLTSKEDFFRHVWQIVQSRIKHFEIQDSFSSNHGMHRRNLAKLQECVFQPKVPPLFRAKLTPELAAERGSERTTKYYQR